MDVNRDTSKELPNSPSKVLVSVKERKCIQLAQRLRNTDPFLLDEVNPEDDACTSVRCVCHDIWHPSIKTKEESLDPNFLKQMPAPSLALRAQGAKFWILTFHKCHKLSEYCKYKEIINHLLTLKRENSK